MKRRKDRAQLARRLQQPASWVSFYLHPTTPTRHADFDTSVEILRVLGVTLDQLLEDDVPLVTDDDLEIRELWRRLGDPKLRALAKSQIRSLLPLAPPEVDIRSTPQSPPVLAKRVRKNSGST